MSKFLIADTHFNDANIIRFENRPFKDVSDMNRKIIDNWNSVVTDNDEVFVAGDIGIDAPNNYLGGLVKALNGRKYLINGNHDNNYSDMEWLGLGFDVVYNYPICINGFYWISHEPMYLNASMPYINIHGHTHSNDMVSAGIVNQYVNVSVEKINYTPIAFSEIKKMFR
jgi:calcineurin-like phosphoesterase family protein